MKAVLSLLLFVAVISGQRSMAQPWKNPLMISWSTDGITFGTPTIFQDSSGVPCVIRWHGDTLIATFQWFRQPNPSPSWDRVAVKFSYDNGQNWTQPTPIVVNNLPSGFQRPFDPTLVRIANDSLRIFYSSSTGMPPPGGDSIINTYSAKSVDGIHYEFEPGPRVDVDTNRVIDPAVINFNGLWHYLAPAGPPQAGAYHYVGPNGFNFSAVPLIPSDNIHNWTGNYMIESSTELRFYGTGTTVWYNSSPNGGAWNGYVSTNVKGGDPSVLKVAANSYLMVYTGQPYGTGIGNVATNTARVSPNPTTGIVTIVSQQAIGQYRVSDMLGRLVISAESDDSELSIDLKGLAPGMYMIYATALGRPLHFLKQ